MPLGAPIRLLRAWVTHSIGYGPKCVGSPSSGSDPCLHRIELMVTSVDGDQVFMLSSLDDVSVFNDEDQIRSLNRREPMSDDDCGSVLEEAHEALLDQSFALCI